jgi:AAA ATPase domain
MLDRVLDAARTGVGGAVVLHGEPGVGKSTLLGYAMDAAAGFQVLRAVGKEAERELPFAAAQQLCGPRSAEVGQLPAPQREAPGVAFGRVAGSAPDRLLVGLALLGLLSRSAADKPVLCVIDDAQWVDRESVQAFAIAARRLGSEHIAFLFGARTVPGDLHGLLELPRGLTSAEPAGGFALPVPPPVSLPVAGRIEESFRRRIARLPAG